MLDEENKKVLVICINYHAEEESDQFIREIYSLPIPTLLDVCLVDNSSDTKESQRFSQLEDDFPSFLLLSPPKNLGYFGAAAYGLKEYIRANGMPEWVVVANTDISFPQKDFFECLVRFYGAECQVAVVAPGIHSQLSNRDQNPYLRFRPSSKKMFFYQALFRIYPLFLFYQLLSFSKSRFLNSKIPASNMKIPEDIYAPHGSFVIFNRIYFAAGGTLDYASFLFGEEIFVAENVRQLGLQIKYDPRLQVCHNEHSTTGIFRNRVIYRYQRDTSIYLYREFFS